MFGLFGGFKTIKEIANEIGVEPRIFGTALTEMKVNYAVVKSQKEVLLKRNGELITLRFLALSLIPTALEGLMKLQEKFGGWGQEMLLMAQDALQKYFHENEGALDGLSLEE
tara:strand:+ start:943 stop:1278 length:336 start_codon:yes stop_codon:yes gene_type:complete